MRNIELTIGAALLVAVTGASRLAAADTAPSTVPAEDTAAAVVDSNWKAPRTSWGDPSLEGVYSTDDMRSVPRERPAEFGTRERLTPEEFAKRAKEDAAYRDKILNDDAWSSRSFGTRTFGYTSQVIDPPDGRIPAMNATGLARARGVKDRGSYGPGPFETFEDFHLYDRCITRGILGSEFNVIYGNGIRIAQSPDSVVISYEMLPDSRVIPLDARAHVQDDIHQYMGDSRGHWEGGTLVVETTNLTDKTSIGGNGIGIRHSDKMKITERLRRVDPDMVEYVATVDDPLTYTKPFTVRMMWTTQPGYEIFEYACHENNRAVSGGLGGERNYEKRVAEAVAKGLPIPERIPSQPNLDALPDDPSVFININAGEGAE